MGLNLSSVNQRPYIVKDGKKPVNQKEEQEKSARQAEDEQQNAPSKGLALVEDKPKPFVPNYTAQVQQNGWQAAKNQIQAQSRYIAPAATQATDTFEHQNVSANINIAQVLKDFRNTALAIGTPPELQEEVDGYINLINSQVTKDNPNTKLIKSNLKNASSILDAYISETLNKESKVVENWVDAIFLQQIDFKYNENDINPQFLVKFPEKTLNKEQEAPAAAEQPTPQPTAPQMDEELKNMFKYSKQLARENNPKAALLSFQKALTRADELGEHSVKSKIYLEVGDIYNDYNYLPQALTSYHKSLESATENTVKIKAHYSMAQIYDNVNQISPALDHYYTTVAYAGEEDNLVAQSVSLTKMGNIYADMYEQESLDYYSTAKDLAAQTDNSKVKGYIASNHADGLNKFGEPQEALREYSEAVKHYTNADSPQKVAQNYNSAADLMMEYHNINKAKSLLTKGLHFANQTNDLDLIEEMSSKLEILS
ncbi:MAG: hypothetical protein NC390_04475 [Fusobacterium sp.]|nr:hypothetical protein [Fusobacterium sp.]